MELDAWADNSRTERDAERAARAHDPSPEWPAWFTPRRWNDEIPSAEECAP